MDGFLFHFLVLDPQYLPLKQEPMDKVPMMNITQAEIASTVRVTFKELEEGGYKCDFCGNVYTSKSNMLRHRRKHTDGRRFVCRICGKAFHRADYLSEHEKNTHKIVCIKKHR